MKIEKYLAGELSQEEKNSFDNLLKKDNELKELLVLHAEVNKSIRENDIHNFRSRLQEIYTKFTEKKTNTSFKEFSNIKITWPKVSVAAFILFAVIAGSLFLFEQKKIPTTELYSQYYSPYETDIDVRSVNQSQNSLTQAVLLYTKKDYNAAFELLGAQLNENMNDPAVRFYYGLTAIELNRYETAIYQLNELVNSNQQPFSINAKWYLGLCYLKLNEEDKAKSYFEDIANEDGYYSQQAREILKKLS